MNMNLIEEKIKDNGYKITNQRKAIIEVLLEHKNKFLSAEEIYLKSKEKYSQTNFSTIYRNLEILENIGIIHKINMDGISSKYELSYKDEHHHHIICRKCGKTEAIDFCPLKELSDKLKSKNFILTDHKFELYGYCESCDDTK